MFANGLLLLIHSRDKNSLIEKTMKQITKKLKTKRKFKENRTNEVKG